MRRILSRAPALLCAGKIEVNRQSERCDDVCRAAAGHRASRLRHRSACRPVLGHGRRHTQRPISKPQTRNFFAGIRSTGVSASLGIAEHVVQQLQLIIGPLQVSLCPAPNRFACCLLTLDFPAKSCNARPASSLLWLLLPIGGCSAAPSRPAQACRRQVVDVAWHKLLTRTLI